MKKQNKKNFTKSTKTEAKINYKKYSYSLKRRIVNDITAGIISKEEAMLKYGIKSRQSINYWLSKYSLLNYRNQKNYGMKQSPAEQIKELKSRNEELQSSVLILNTVIDIADEQLNTNLRKKYLSQQLCGLKNVKNKER